MALAGDACLGPAESSGLVSTGSIGRIVTGLIFGSGAAPPPRWARARISLPEDFPGAKLSGCSGT